ncbi:DNA -binding domain-containing protein [Mesorhizobium sp. RIZ17]|uniref:DNA -binding domain-containing protein n=1 Tax=Mesorhizobium sp. RIZ17 TaxID=3132743 RepID=UPI003DA8AE8A
MIEPFDEAAPDGDDLTEYDRTHVKLYMRLFDADADGADWREVVKVLFGIDPTLEPQRARRVYDSHLARARWMTRSGYRQLLRQSNT